MRVRIKSEKEIKQYKEKRNGAYSNGSCWLFIKEKFEFCNKIVEAKETFTNTEGIGKVYRIYNEKEILPYHWESWMFHILPEKDENGNYLLEL